MRIIYCILFLFVVIPTMAQTSYKDSLNLYLENYVAKHEVVKGKDKEHLSFYDVDGQYRVMANFTATENSPWFEMPTSGKMKKLFRIYGVVKFKIGNANLQLNLYKSQSLMQDPAYADYLFLPFTDATSGIESYAGGRYIDLKTSDIIDGKIVIDFNKAYNPYCAYVLGVYNCPIPPKENNLNVAIRAGEKDFPKTK